MDIGRRGPDRDGDRCGCINSFDGVQESALVALQAAAFNVEFAGRRRLVSHYFLFALTLETVVCFLDGLEMDNGSKKIDNLDAWMFDGRCQGRMKPFASPSLATSQLDSHDA